MNLLFFGSGAFGVPTLRRLARAHRIVAIVTQPDRPAGRGAAPTPTPVAAFATAHLAPARVYAVERVNEPALVAELRGLQADAWVVIAFGQRLGPALLQGAFAINLHASLLPRWRGAAPINAAILAGDAETGNSVITVADRMDAGDVLAQSRMPIDPMHTAGELHDALAADGPALVERVLDDYARGTLSPRPQDESAVTLAPKLSKADGWVDFAQGAEACRRRIHGLTPWPGVAIRFRDQPLKLRRVKPAGEAPQTAPPGTVIDAEAGLVACAGSALALLEVQPAGGRVMTWPDFARGRRVSSGERLHGSTGSHG
jgi:methionyl-tRNA formyltransferase